MRLSVESAREIQESSNEEWFRLRKERFPNALVGIAEGDSWFDYAPSFIENPLLGDLINQLNKTRKFNLLRVAIAGDTLENMTFGTDAKPPQLQKTLGFIHQYQPDFFIFSGGGNDVAGPNGLKFEPFLNHSKSKLNVLRADYLDYMVNTVFFEMFNHLIQEVIRAKPDIKIFLHSYGYPIPDGRAVIDLEDFQFIGPWFKPPLDRKKLNQMQGEKVVHTLIDALSNLLKRLEAQYSQNITFIDLRPIITQHIADEGGGYTKVWGNELHLTVNGYKRVTEEFQRRILEIFPGH
ncbi:MAG: GDSL-type esterase/lipase family protein [Thermosynechococcaceae cyanobacterium]